MTNDFKYRFTNCRSCRYNCDDGAECIECDKCSNCKIMSDNIRTVKCNCLKLATTAKTCPYYMENEK